MMATTELRPAGPDHATLDVRGASVEYGTLKAVQDVSFDVRPGEVVVLLGANGAGKSSLLKALIGFEPLASGEAEFKGEDISRKRVHQRAAMGIGYLPEGRGVFANMTVEDNIAAGVPRGGSLDDALSRAFTLFPKLEVRRKQIAGSMSGGEQQMLSLSRAIASNPELLLLDELSLGLAPKIVVQLLEQVGVLRDNGHSILLVEQFAHAALRVADRAGIMVRGQLTHFGDAATLSRLSPEELARLYFGNEPAPGS
jgi:branched-chain amino acid transport system ATP-binding protein